MHKFYSADSSADFKDHYFVFDIDTPGGGEIGSDCHFKSDDYGRGYGGTDAQEIIVSL